MKTQNRLPDIVTHNYDPVRGRFHNICDLPRSEAERILREMRQSPKSRLKANYLERRLNVEKWLREKRQKLIGLTSRMTPIYFFVGDFSDCLDPLRPKSFQMRLDTFPDNVVTFTYSDSMSCFEDANDGDQHSPPFPRKLFALNSLKDVVKKWGIPKNDTATQFRQRPFIEMQLWDDSLLRKMRT